MTLLQLHYFIDLAMTQSFTKVAKNYFVAQSVVSYQIQALEKELGTTLFERSTRSVRLTAAGRCFYTDVVPLVNGLEQAIERAKRQTIRVSFLIGYSRVCYGSRFHELLGKLMALHPETEFVLERSEPEDGLLQRLQAQELDAALFFNPYHTLPEHLNWYDFGIGRQMMVMHRDYPLSSRSSVSKDEVPPSEILACAGMRKMETAIGAQQDFLHYDNKGIVLKDLDSVLAMLHAKRGVACLPLIDDLGVPELAYVPLSDAVYTHLGPHLTLAWSPIADAVILRDLQQLALELLPIPGRRPEKHAD